MRSEMSDHEVIQAIDELADLGSLLLTVTGGEIFIRPGIFEILEHADQRGFVLELFTSGTPLNAEKVARLSKLSIGRVQISLYSHDPEIHDSVTESKGSWLRSVATARELIEHGIHVDFACTLMRHNFRHSAELKNFAESMAATVSFGYPITARTDGDRDTHELRLTANDLEEAIRAQPDFFALPKFKSPEERICPVGVNMCSITSTGDVLPCSQFHLSLGNIRDQALAEIWETSPAVRHLREVRMRDLMPSSRGMLPVYVGLCPGLNLLEEGNYLVPATVTAETTLAVGRSLEEQRD